MENTELLKMLQDLHSLDLPKLYKKIFDIQLTYGDWSKLMGKVDCENLGFSGLTQTEQEKNDADSLLGKNIIGYEEYERLSKLYGYTSLHMQNNLSDVEKQLQKLSKLLQDKLTPETSLKKYTLQLKLYKENLKIDDLSPEERDEYLKRIDFCKKGIERCTGFVEQRNNSNISIKNAVTEIILRGINTI